MTKLNGIFVITNPRPLAGIVPVRNIISILHEIFPSIYLFTGNEGGIILKEFSDIKGQSVNYVSNNFRILKIIAYARLQIHISLSLIQESKYYEHSFFFMAEGLFLPVIIAKLLRKKPILCLTGSMQNMIVHTSDDSISNSLLRIMEEISYRMADIILVYSPKLIKEWDLEKYESKIKIAHEHHIDFNLFRIEKNLSERPDMIGYIGRLSKEKGFENFLDSLPELVENNKSIKILIAGEGPLQSLISGKLKDKQLTNHILLKKWIPHDELPRFYNNLKLLVIPSYTEGLPNVLLEAMACGTPVLATPVGAIPDYIIEGKTGFLMKNNDPESISKNIHRALKSGLMHQIVTNAHDIILEKFSINNTIDRYRKIFEEIQ